MIQEEQLTQVQSEINALKRQMRQLLEVVALVQEQAGASRDAPRGAGTQAGGEQHAQAAEPAPLLRPIAGPPGARAQPPEQERYSGTERRGGGEAVRAGGEQPPEHAPRGGNEAALAPLYAENGRLVDMLRTQAEELGALRERVRQLELARQPQRDPLAASLRALLQALHEDPPA